MDVRFRVKYDNNKKWVIHDYLKKIPLKKKGNPHSIPKEFNS
jgi:hypothetical protein